MLNFHWWLLATSIGVGASGCAQSGAWPGGRFAVRPASARVPPSMAQHSRDDRSSSGDRDGSVKTRETIVADTLAELPADEIRWGAEPAVHGPTAAGWTESAVMASAIVLPAVEFSAEEIVSGQPVLPRRLPADDPEAVGGQEVGPRLTLDQAVAFCLANDPVLRAGWQEIRQAYGDQVTAALKPNPELEIIQSLLPLGRPFNELDRQGGPPQFDLGLAVPIDWYIFGKRTAAMQAALRNRLATELEYADLVRRRVLEVSLAFYDVLEQQALVELTQLDVDNLTAVEQITRQAVDSGAMPRVEYSRIRLDRLGSEQVLREGQRDLVTAQAALRGVLGWEDVWGAIEVQGELASPPDEAFPEPAHGYAMAQANRPDTEALRARILEAGANLNAENREAFPEVVPMMGYTRQFQERAIGFPSVSSWGVGLSMSLPLHNRNQGNRLKASSERVQRLEELRAG